MKYNFKRLSRRARQSGSTLIISDRTADTTAIGQRLFVTHSCRFNYYRPVARRNEQDVRFSRGNHRKIHELSRLYKVVRERCPNDRRRRRVLLTLHGNSPKSPATEVAEIPRAQGRRNPDPKVASPQEVSHFAPSIRSTRSTGARGSRKGSLCSGYARRSSQGRVGGRSMRVRCVSRPRYPVTRPSVSGGRSPAAAVAAIETSIIFCRTAGGAEITAGIRKRRRRRRSGGGGRACEGRR